MSVFLKEVTNFGKNDKQDVITPHRLTVAILIKCFCQFRDSDEFKDCTNEILKAKYRRDFSVLIIRLIQSPDLLLDELWNLIMSEKYTLAATVVISFERLLATLNNSGTGNLVDIIDSLNRVMTFNDNAPPTDFNKCFISKSSVVGYFLRRLIVNFEKLSFSEVTEISHAFQRYCSKWHKRYDLGIPEDNKKKNVDVDDWNTGRNIWTRRQAELFIATQAALISNNEEKAINHPDLQKIISNLLKTNPDLAEAHFLSYLNYLRVKEYCGAVDSLYHFFDRSNIADFKASSEDRLKNYRFAALNLAVLHYHFGHYEEALASLKEAIKISQEANDNICLQHALSWLYRLTIINKDKLIEHSVLKSFELSLSYTTSLGIQTFVQLACLVSGNAYQIFETMTKSDIINLQHNHRDLISNSYAVKSSLWQFYGKTEMSLLWNQLLFYLNIDNPKPSKALYGEGFCLSICNIANNLCVQGDYVLSKALLCFAKDRFPNEPNCHIWMLSENLLVFTMAMHHENWNEAESAAQKITVLDEWEGYLRLAELYLYKEDYKEAEKCVNILINAFQSENKHKYKGYHHVRAQILLAEIQIASSFPNSVPTGIMELLNTCLVDTYVKNQLEYHTAYIQLLIAHIELSLGMSSQALKVIEKCIIQILSHGGCYDRGRAILLYAKCLIADSEKMEWPERQNVISACVEMLNKAKDNFNKIEAYYRVKDILYLQAFLYNKLDLLSERNRCALELRKLNEEYDSKNKSTLIKFM